jgi:putative glutamine amidotransferase
MAYHSASAADRRRLVHRVRIHPATRLHAILGVGETAVTSTHHQFVKEVAPGFRVSAESAEDGIVEAIEQPAFPFLVAVLWHPERMVHEHAEHLALFRGLVSAARRSEGQNTNARPPEGGRAFVVE